jgi:hypothetical protein
MKKNVHRNSSAAFHQEQDAGRLSRRNAEILKVVSTSVSELSDREVMRELGYTDPNKVRPGITTMIKCGVLCEVGTKVDSESRKRVRLVSVRKGRESRPMLPEGA